mmetsp:Transcript_33406/g.95979  ORF Transcript_33406/g.95979 Transcript_33406/m.95979 type:complete len:292 (-) Transcript_33406:283-1158(-)
MPVGREGEGADAAAVALEDLKAVAAGCVPELRRAVHGARGQQVPTRCERNRKDRTTVPSQRQLALPGRRSGAQGRQRLPSQCLHKDLPPKLRRTCLRACRQQRPIRAESDGPDGAGMAGQDSQALSRLHAPDGPRAVTRASCQPRAVWRASDGADRAMMALESMLQMSTQQAPYVHGAVHASRCQQQPVGREGNRQNCSALPLEHPLTHACLRAPDLRIAILVGGSYEEFGAPYRCHHGSIIQPDTNDGLVHGQDLIPVRNQQGGASSVCQVPKGLCQLCYGGGWTQLQPG